VIGVVNMSVSVKAVLSPFSGLCALFDVTLFTTMWKKLLLDHIAYVIILSVCILVELFSVF